MSFISSRALRESGLSNGTMSLDVWKRCSRQVQGVLVLVQLQCVEVTTLTLSALHMHLDSNHYLCTPFTGNPPYNSANPYSIHRIAHNPRLLIHRYSSISITNTLQTSSPSLSSSYLSPTQLTTSPSYHGLATRP